MARFWLMVGVVFLGWASAAQAVRIPFCGNVYLNADDVDPRKRQQDIDGRQATEQGAIAGATSLTGRHLPAVEIESRNTDHLIDVYFLLGDIDPLISKYGNAIKSAEQAYLERQKNLKILEKLNEVRDSHSGAIIAELKAQGLLSSQEERILAREGSAPKITLALKIAELERQNVAHEATIGRYFEEWETLRLHLKEILEGDDEFLLAVVRRLDNTEISLESMVAFEAMPRLAAAIAPEIKPGERLSEEIEEKLQKSKERVAKIHELIREIHEKLEQVKEAEDFEPSALYVFLEQKKLLTDDLAAALETKNLEKVKAELVLIRRRLHRAAELVDLAAKLDSAVGIQPEDIRRLNLLIEPDAVRPTHDQMKKVARESNHAIDAKNWNDFRKQAWAVFDGLIMYGEAGSMIPTLGRAFEKVNAPWARNFVYFLFQDLYRHHARNKYLSGIFFLLKTKATTQELRQHLENLNGGTKDGFLEACARFPEMRLLWKQIRDEAEKDKDTDHLKLHERMVKAEETARQLGSVSFIDQSSYTRYIVATILNGSILFAGGKLLALLAAGDDDDDKKKEVEIRGGDADTEKVALASFNTLVRAMRPGDDTPAREVDAAAVRLWELENRLSLVR